MRPATSTTSAISHWALAHASALADLNGDGRPDLITGKRAQARGPEGSEKEPLVLYWYESRAVAARGTAGSPDVEWIRHVIHEGGDVGGGLQIRVADMEADGDLDLVASGKTGLFLIENAAAR
ncbi:MAG: VCBS repeat-containing protein [Acidobacteria bacterium]|nr:VCBS repeat-containing protein [Acidobacteriota bacterium]